MALSALARYMRKNRMLRFGTGASGRRVSSMQPAMGGETRGTMGSLGSTFMKTRNSDAGENLDRRQFGLPETPYSKIMRGG
jgi:hypothetical protein